MDVLVNIVELASELAHNRTLYESGDICNNEDEMYIQDDPDCLIYKDEIQERFNNWYDEYFTIISDIAM
jgi:hypothetical protein